MVELDFIVIGGGISGVSFAAEISKEKSVLLLEKSDYLGGCIHTVVDDDFFLELGAHTIYNSYSSIIDMIDRYNLKTNILSQSKKPLKLWIGNRLHSIFSQINWIEAFMSPFRKADIHSSVKEYYTELLGHNNYINIMKPVLDSIICQDCDNFAAWLLLKSRKKNKQYPRSFSYKDGIQRFVEDLALNFNYKLNAEVLKIEYKTEDSSFIVYTKDDTYFAHKVVLAVPVNYASKLTENLYPSLSSHLSSVVVNNTNAVGYEVNSECVKIPYFSYAIGKNKPFRGVVSRDCLYNEENRAFTFHYKSETEPADSLYDIKETLKIKENADIRTYKKSFELPLIGINHDKWLDSLKTELKQCKNFFLLGNYFYGLSLEDCVIRAKEAVLEALNE